MAEITTTEKPVIESTEIEGLSLLRGDSYKISDNATILHPTLGQIEQIGYAKYSEYLSCLISTSIDIADVLWFEMKIWYEDIKDEWDFFLQKCIGIGRMISVNFVDSKGRSLRHEDECLCLSSYYRDALNFFFNQEGEYVVLKHVSDNIKQTVIYNVIPDDNGEYSLLSSAFQFTKYTYEMTTNFLRKVNRINTDHDFLHGGNKRAKKYILEHDYKARKKNRKERYPVTLESIVSSLIAKGQDAEEIWNYPIYLIYSIYYRLVKINEYENTMNALYNGCIDTKKHPIDWEKINWSAVI